MSSVPIDIINNLQRYTTSLAYAKQAYLKKHRVCTTSECNNSECFKIARVLSGYCAKHEHELYSEDNIVCTSPECNHNPKIAGGPYQRCVKHGGFWFCFAPQCTNSMIGDNIQYCIEHSTTNPPIILTTNIPLPKLVITDDMNSCLYCGKNKKPSHWQACQKCTIDTVICPVDVNHVKTVRSIMCRSCRTSETRKKYKDRKDELLKVFINNTTKQENECVSTNYSFNIHDKLVLVYFDKSYHGITLEDEYDNIQDDVYNTKHQHNNIIIIRINIATVNEKNVLKIIQHISQVSIHLQTKLTIYFAGYSTQRYQSHKSFIDNAMRVTHFVFKDKS